MSKTKIAGFLALCLTLISFNVFAYTPPPAPMPPQSYIADIAHKLAPADLSVLNTKIRMNNRSTRNEIAILIISSLEGEEMSVVAHTTFRSWGVGKRGLDNGVLIVVAIAEHRTRIEVGKGIEGDLTDLQSNDIIRNHVNPFFKKGDFFGGLSVAVDEISRTVESRKDAGATTPPDAGVAKPLPVIPPAPKTNPRTDAGGCDVSAAGLTFEGDTMLILLALTALVGFVIWRWVSASRRYTENYDPYERSAPVEPTYYPPAPVKTVVHHAYGGGVSGGGYPIAPPAYIPPPLVEEDNDILPVIGAVAGAAAISSLFSNSSDDDSGGSGWGGSNDDSPSLPDPSSDSPSSSDDSGFGGGDSGGGGSDGSWDD